MVKQLLLLSAALIMAVSGDVVVGGFSKKNPVDYTDKAWKSVPQINAQSNDGTYLVPIKVTAAQVQVVAGLNIKLEVLVGESTCQKGGSIQLSQIDAANCPLKQGGSRALYQVNIFEQSWTNVQQISAKKIRDVAAGEQF